MIHTRGCVILNQGSHLSAIKRNRQNIYNFNTGAFKQYFQFFNAIPQYFHPSGKPTGWLSVYFRTLILFMLSSSRGANISFRSFKTRPEAAGAPAGKHCPAQDLDEEGRKRPAAAVRGATLGCCRAERPDGGHPGPAPTRSPPRLPAAPEQRCSVLKRGQNALPAPTSPRLTPSTAPV